MSIEFTTLTPLTALAGLVALVWWQRRTLAPLSPRRRLLSLALRCAIYALVVLALTEPRWFSQRRETHVVWLVDRSRSLGDSALEKARAFVAAAADVKSQSWISFAGKSAVVHDAKAEPAPARDLDDTRTDLAAALQFAEASFPPGYAKTVVVFSDGVETSGDALAATAALRDVRVHTVQTSPPERPEALVRGVEAPRQVKEDEPFRVSAEIVANRELEADVEIFKSGARVATKTEKLKAGANRFEFTQTLKGDEKLSEFTVAVRPKNAADDTFADNNLASAYVQTEGKSKALLLADKPDSARYLALALRQEGILLDVRPPTGAPTEMADLQNYDLLILDNVAATDLQPAQQKLFASYVREFGGGLLMMGGDQSYGLGGYYQTPVEEVLPVRCDFEKEKENPSLGLVVVIDRSGSMSGEKMEMAKDAAKAAVEVLGPRDYAGVVAFDNEAFWASEIQLATDKGGIQQRIASIQAGGGTNIAPGLEQAFQKLTTTPAKLKHVILLTDGVSTPGPFYELTTQMAQARITVSTVAVGSDSDTKLLEQIAQWGNGRYYFTDNPQSIPQIFTKETMTASKSAIQEAPFLPIVTRPADFLAGVAFDTAPFLLGYVTTKAKPTAEVWLVTERGEPLLATWRYGLGQSAAFTSDARNRWAVEWLKWEGFGKFWAQTARRLTRSKSLRHFPAELARERDGFRLTVDAVDEGGRFLGDLDGELSLLDPAQRASRVAFERTAPGRYEAWWPAPERGGYHAQIVFKANGEPVERQYLSAAVGYPDEFLLKPADEAKLRALAEKTGGTFNVATAEVLKNDARTAPLERELWPWLLALALALFIADVAAKRWPDDAAARPGSGAANATPQPSSRAARSASPT